MGALNRVGGMVLVLLLTACGSSHHTRAPVYESNWHLPTFFHFQREHVVKRGDTLYSIAFHYDKDYHQLALINHLRPPYTLYVGQTVRLQPSTIPPSSYKPPAKLPIRHAVSRSFQPARVVGQTKMWIWPTRGRLMSRFAPAEGRKGINIAGSRKQAIVAAASGVVAYAGDGLSGYGNLIIIQHSGRFMTAYGNNWRNLVHEGQHVAKGQRIAEMGMIDRRYWGLHFEMRESGNPKNPLVYLPRK